MIRNRQPSTRIFFGHHRSASTWILNILTSVADALHLSVTRFHEIDPGRSQGLDLVADVNARWEHRHAFDDWLGFHVIRDPRDIVVSAYFSHMYSHPSGDWLDEQRQRLRQVDQHEGIKLSIDFRENQFQEMAAWGYGEDHRIYETKFEVITQHTLPEFKRIFRFLGLFPQHIGEETLSEILYQHRFEKLTEGRKPGEEDPHHHYRKGVAGDWKQYFNEENKAYFKENWGELLIRLGYEEDQTW